MLKHCHSVTYTHSHTHIEGYTYVYTQSHTNAPTKNPPPSLPPPHPLMHAHPTHTVPFLGVAECFEGAADGFEGLFRTGGEVLVRMV